MQVSVIEHAASEIRFIILFSHPCSDEFLRSTVLEHYLKKSHFTTLLHLISTLEPVAIFKDFRHGVIEMKDDFWGDFQTMCGGQTAWQKSGWQLLDSQTLTLCVVKLLCPSCDAALSPKWIRMMIV